MISYNVRDPQGRAIAHILEHSTLNQALGNMLLLTEYAGGGRTLMAHPAWDPSPGEAHLLVFLESLAGQGSVNLWLLLNAVDTPNRELVAQAVWLAAGFDIAMVAAS